MLTITPLPEQPCDLIMPAAASHTAIATAKKKRQFPLPTREERDHLINVVYGADVRPARCELPGHGTPEYRRNECDTCRAFCRWRARMGRRFLARGLALTLDDRQYDDPKPPPCPEGHAFNPVNCVACKHCKALENWKNRERNRQRRDGVATKFQDLDTLLAHLRLLIARGMTSREISRAAQCSISVVQTLLAGRDGSTERQYVRAQVAARLLAVPVPERVVQLVPDVLGVVRRRVDATGTRRRIQAAGRAGHSLAQQARRYGWAHSTVRDWLTCETVMLDVADVVAEAFPTLISRPGDNRIAAGVAASKGWVEARYFSATNIDDPTYEPFTVIDNPVGVYRMMRALAWMGVGPRQVAAFIGEDRRQVEVWMEGGPAPAYARHMVEAAFDALAGERGPEDALARRARSLRWAPPLAWYDIDIDDFRSRACTGLPVGCHKVDYPLHSQVQFAIRGWIGADELLKEEKVRVVRYLHGQGMTDRQIATWLRWNHEAPDGGVDAVCQFRRREHIVPNAA